MAESTQTAKLKAPEIVPANPASIPAGRLNNQWRITVVDKEGNEQHFRLGGTTSAAIALQHSQWIANGQAMMAVENGMPDPELRVTKVEGIGHRGNFQPGTPPTGVAVKPIDLNRYVINPAHGTRGAPERQAETEADKEAADKAKRSK